MWAFLHSSRKNNYIFFSFVLLINAVEENSLSAKYLLWFNILSLVQILFAFVLGYGNV